MTARKVYLYSMSNYFNANKYHRNCHRWQTPESSVLIKHILVFRNRKGSDANQQTTNTPLFHSPEQTDIWGRQLGIGKQKFVMMMQRKGYCLAYFFF